MKKKKREYLCCNGDPECANNIIEKHVDDLFDMYEKNPEKAKEELIGYIQSVETDREMARFKLKELQNLYEKEKVTNKSTD